MRPLPAARAAQIGTIVLLSTMTTTALVARPGVPLDAFEASPLRRTSVMADASLFGHSGRLRVTIGHTGGPLTGIQVDGSCKPLRWRSLQEPRLLETACSGAAILAPDEAGIFELVQITRKTEEKESLLASVGFFRRTEEESVDVIDGVPAILALRPREEKMDGLLEGYRIGEYPERPARYGPSYEPPSGFVRVTEETARLHISEHFTLGEFLTKDQHDQWPKYLALDMRLIDKLELLIGELRAMGLPARGLFIMSGFRTPNYNGGGGGGRSRFSRHIYGDAADVWLDDSGDGRMDDLNGDGKSTILDARVLAKAAGRVEDRFPDLSGGIGVYGSRGARGPFVHVDVRGRRARW